MLRLKGRATAEHHFWLAPAAASRAEEREAASSGGQSRLSSRGRQPISWVSMSERTRVRAPWTRAISGPGSELSMAVCSASRMKASCSW